MLGSGLQFDKHTFDQIVSVDVVQNGVTINQTNRGSQLIGVIAGGVLFGGVGAIVGGLSGSTRSKHRIRSLSMKVIVDNQIRPVHNISFYASTDKKGTDSDSVLLSKPKTYVERFHAHVLTAMKRAHEQSFQSPPPLPSNSRADDLFKLWQLREAGALTDAEFESQKALLIGGSAEQGGTLALTEPSPK